MKALVIVLLFTFDLLAQVNSIIVTRINDSMYKLYVSDYVYMYTFSGSDGTLLIDTGYQVEEGMLKKQLKELGVEDVKYIVNTHSNGDHVGGNHYFNNAAIIAHERLRENLSADSEFPKEGLPNITLNDEISLRFNSEEIRIIALPGGHTNNDIIIHFVSHNFVFLGDIIVADTFPVVWLDYYEDTGIDKLVSNLERIIEMFPDDAMYISSHGRDYTKDDLKVYYNMVTETIAIVKKAIDQGKTLDEIRNEDLLKDFRFYDSERFQFINADFWIGIIYKDLIK